MPHHHVKLLAYVASKALILHLADQRLLLVLAGSRLGGVDIGIAHRADERLHRVELDHAVSHGSAACRNATNSRASALDGWSPSWSREQTSEVPASGCAAV